MNFNATSNIYFSFKKYIFHYNTFIIVYYHWQNIEALKHLSVPLHLDNNDCFSQVAPPLPRKGPPVKTSSLEAKDNVLYTQVEMQNYKERARSPTEGRNFSLTEPLRIHKCFTADQGTVYSELIVPNCRSQSLPLLDDNTEDDLHFNRQNSPTKGLPSISTSLGKLCNTSLYQLAGTPGNQNTTRQKESTVNTHEPTYAEVPPKPVSNDIENTYEQIPDSRLEARALENSTHTNTYETLLDLKPKPINSARAVKVSAYMCHI